MTLIEANPLKFYFAKFLFLAVASSSWLMAVIFLALLNTGDSNVALVLGCVLMGGVSFMLFILVNDNVRRVAISRTKIIIMEGNKNSRFGWPDVKSLKNIRFFNIYRLKLRGKRRPIYFFPAVKLNSALELIHRNPARIASIFSRRKNEYDVR